MPSASAGELSPYMLSALAGERAVRAESRSAIPRRTCRASVGEPLPYMPGASAGELSPYTPSASAGEGAVRAESLSAIPRRSCKASVDEPLPYVPSVSVGELSPCMPSASAGKLAVMLNRKEASRPARGWALDDVMLDTPVYFFSRLVLAALVGARREVDGRQVHIRLQDL
ncbi:hypothetical protein T492DRAFT_100042 [Pavlovales sp. CCMP2436]|nr:hypothetical protein T492DRAFT_100042 [Pavlovales sp. CCMP2436]